MRKVSLLLCGIGCLATALVFVDDASAAKRPYRYVPLDAAVPDGFDFFDPVSISDSRRIYGTLSACTPDDCSPSVAVFFRGKIAVLHEGFAASANNRATVGGGVVLDPDQHTTQAALFTNAAVTLIPPLHNDEFTSAVRLLTDTRIAFVDSFDQDFNLSQYLTRHGNVTPLDFGPEPAEHLSMNDRGRISGTFLLQDGNRAFRYAPFSGKLRLLEPLPTEPNSWGQAINSRGDVLGYSFVSGGLERIGVWRGTRFRTYFVEGTAELPTVSNRLLWNEQGLIVITDTTDLNSYLVPRPGVRLNLADLTRSPLPAWTEIIDINNNGDLIGVGGERRFERSVVFLLRRVGPVDGDAGEADGLAASRPQSGPALTRAARHGSALEGILHQRLYDGLAIRKDRTAKSASLHRE